MLLICVDGRCESCTDLCVRGRFSSDVVNVLELYD